MKKKYKRYMPIIYRKFNLYDYVRVKDTGETGWVVAILKTGSLVIEKETDESDDKLIYDVRPSQIEKMDE